MGRSWLYLKSYDYNTCSSIHTMSITTPPDSCVESITTPPDSCVESITTPPDSCVESITTPPDSCVEDLWSDCDEDELMLVVNSEDAQEQKDANSIAQHGVQ